MKATASRVVHTGVPRRSWDVPIEHLVALPFRLGPQRTDGCSNSYEDSRHLSVDEGGEGGRKHPCTITPTMMSKPSGTYKSWAARIPAPLMYPEVARVDVSLCHRNEDDGDDERMPPCVCKPRVLHGMSFLGSA